MRWTLIVLAFLCTSAYSSTPQTPNSESGKHQPQQEQNGTEKFPIFIKGEVTTKKDEDESKEDAREREIKGSVDESLVKYTAHLAFATYLLFFFTACLFGVTYQLSRDAKKTGDEHAGKMERSIAEAGRAANAMEGIANATAENANKFQDMMQKQFRAYVSIEWVAACHQDENIAFQMDMSFRNDGLTPAKNVSYSMRVGVLPTILPADFAFEVEEPVGMDATMAPRQVFSVKQFIQRLPEVESEQAFDQGDKSLCAWGTVEYEDIFGCKRSTNFCHLVHFVRLTDEAGKAQISRIHRYNPRNNNST